jgi:hypothetical protein
MSGLFKRVSALFNRKVWNYYNKLARLGIYCWDAVLGFGGSRLGVDNDIEKNISRLRLNRCFIILSLTQQLIMHPISPLVDV